MNETRMTFVHLEDKTLYGYGKDRLLLKNIEWQGKEIVAANKQYTVSVQVNKINSLTSTHMWYK